ncbi:uncharacterized protein N7498_003491 [Penicillium cinerascens]|uniref:Apple domain-containing protein n=1 Tax=Penicillium cinerascens TaxID=70096 RepID=A0A9W9N2B4_9EURO|nr:uncharacterized protein N7498_003491 [Penicillium cinerascens]KAJ5211845.1 hypothetical protein N7498_003491 [Penicillium cinerascens]
MIIKTTLFLYFATAWAQQGPPPGGGPCSSNDPATCCLVAGQSEGQINLDGSSLRYTCGAYANPSQGQGHIAANSRECASLCASNPSCQAASWSLANSQKRCYFAKGESYEIRQNSNWLLLERFIEDDSIDGICPPDTVFVDGKCVPDQGDTGREIERCKEENSSLLLKVEKCQSNKEECTTQYEQVQSEKEACGNQVTACQDKVTNLELAKSTCEAQNTACESRTRACKDRITDLELAKSTCDAEKNFHKDKAETCNARLTDLESELSTLENKLGKCEVDKSALEAQLHESQAWQTCPANSVKVAAAGGQDFKIWCNQHWHTWGDVGAPRAHSLKHCAELCAAEPRCKSAIYAYEAADATFKYGCVFKSNLRINGPAEYRDSGWHTVSKLE